jgi:hypothetical protein
VCTVLGPEICGNGIDDDCDGHIDCAGEVLAGVKFMAASPQTQVGYPGALAQGALVNGAPYFGLEANSALVLPSGGSVQATRDAGIDLFTISGGTTSAPFVGPSSLVDDRFVALVPRASGKYLVAGTMGGPVTWGSTTACTAGTHCAFLAEVASGAPGLSWELGTGIYGLAVTPGEATTWFVGYCAAGGTILGSACSDISFVGQLDSTNTPSRSTFSVNPGSQSYVASAQQANLIVGGSFGFSFSIFGSTVAKAAGVDLYLAKFTSVTAGQLLSTMGGPGFDQFNAIAVAPSGDQIAALVSIGSGTGTFHAGSCALPALAASSRLALLVFDSTGTCQAILGYAKGTTARALAWTADSKQLLVGGGFVGGSLGTETFGGPTSYNAAIPTVTGTYPTDGFVATYTPALGFMHATIVSTPDDADMVESFVMSPTQAWAAGDTQFRASAMPTEVLTVGSQTLSPLNVPAASVSANYFLVPIKP